MIINFEEITSTLSEEDLKFVWIISHSLSARDKSNPIKGPEIVSRVNSYIEAKRADIKTKLTEPKLRKICNYIRSNGIIPLIATSNGYYTSYDKRDVLLQMKSLQDRADAITNCIKGMERFIIEG